METYYGFVETPADAVKLFDACLAGRLPRVRRKLQQDEMRLIRSGSIFVWIDKEAGSTWYDGKSWGTRRRSGEFSLWAEKASQNDYNANGLPNQLHKKSLKTEIPDGRQIYLVSYHSLSQTESPRLQQPSKDPQLRHIISFGGMYPELIHNNTNPMPVLEMGLILKRLPQPIPTQARLLAPFVSTQHRGENDGELLQRSPIELLSLCRYLIDREFINGRVEEAAEHLAYGINILNNLDYYYPMLSQTTLNEVLNETAPGFQRLNLIQLCYYDKQDFQSLSFQYELESRFNSSLSDTSSSNNQPSGSIDAVILDAIRYIRAASNGPLMDSRESSRTTIPEQQNQICTSINKCYKSYWDRGLLCAEMKMKFHTIKICLLVCHFKDESKYDNFIKSFDHIVKIASSTMEKYPDVPFGFAMRCLPLLNFVILKCRHFETRYQAWEIVRRLAEDEQWPVKRDNFPLVGKVMIEKEHMVKIEDVNQDSAKLLPMPDEETRVNDYTSDKNFKDLGIVPGVHKLPYNEQLLLRCGSSELENLAGWFQSRSPSP